MQTDETQNELREMTDDEKISGLLAALPRVEAPNDFDFRVRARIAAAPRSINAGTRIPMAVRYAFPLVLLLLLGMYFVFDRFYPAGSASVPPVAEDRPGIPPPQTLPQSNDGNVQPDNETLAGGKVSRTPEAVNPGSNTPATPKTSLNSRPPEKVSTGGSFDETSNIKRAKFPKGFDPNRKPTAKPRDFDQTSGESAKDVLSLIGIDGRYSESSWTVGNVRAHSTAERAGVKTGDVVEAINDEPISEKTSFHGAFTGKSLKIRREGREIRIDLKP